VTAETDGHVAWVPKRAKQPTTVRVGEARVLSDDEYTQVAPYL
jgi:hypothetical protein